MCLRVKRIVLLLGFIFFSICAVFSDNRETHNNYTGLWETPSSWNPAWPTPQSAINNLNISINGYITAYGSISLSGSSELVVNDTLVIIGDLTIDDQNDLVVNNNGILIVRGNLSFSNHSSIIADGYIIVTGNIIKVGSLNHGSFQSNDNPVHLFIFGTISPSSLTDNESGYDAIDCTNSSTTPYANSGCSYGNETDLVNDTIYTFFVTTFLTATITSSDADNTFCSGTSVTFSASGGANFNFRVDGVSAQNSTLSTFTTAALTNGQVVDVSVYNTAAFSVASTGITNTVLTLPVPSLVGSSEACEGTTDYLYTTEAGMSSYIWNVSLGGTVTAGGNFESSTATITWTTSGAKTVTVSYTNGNGCVSENPTVYNVNVNSLPEPLASNNGPLCEGLALQLFGEPEGMISYSWVGPNGFTSSLSSPLVATSASAAMSGVYSLLVTSASGCSNTASTSVLVNALPLVTITSSNSSLCINDVRVLTGTPAGGVFTLINGPGEIIENVLYAFGIGTISIEYTYSNGCSNKTFQFLEVYSSPIAFAGPNQELTFTSEAHLAAELNTGETGEWSLVSGQGNIINIYSPTTRVTGLAVGDNVFLWTIQNGFCSESANVVIAILDLFVPSVITPNGDGKNDYLRISENIGQVNLVIFNQWGNVEFTSSNYLNNWDGRNSKGIELPSDTYFYILKFENGKIKKGSVLIKR
jgi:gliding motility-associated-like protein